MLLWAPAYWLSWGPINFLHLCDIAVILTCIGFWINSRLLISSQAVSTLFVGIAWALDAGWQAVLGHHLIGGTEYLFDASHPFWVRLLSFYHIAIVIVLLWALRRVGYDGRAFALQTAIALATLAASRLTPPAMNLNYAFTDPFFHRAWGPAPAHVAVTIIFVAVVGYLPTHLFFAKFFPQRG